MKKLFSHSKTYTMSENKISTNNYSSSTMPVDNEIAKLEAEFQKFIRSKHKHLSSYTLTIEKNKSKKTEKQKNKISLLNVSNFFSN